MRKQRAFASLTEAELDQIAGWLRHETYDAVLERVRKPRPEGFALDISRRPLESLHTKTNKIDQINRRIAAGQKLTLSEFDAINGGERDDVTDEVHHAIMEATYDLATSGDNTPTQLLALQRLADFPARAEYRAHRKELDTQMRAHKIEMDLHRKHITDERLELSKRSLALREKMGRARAPRVESGASPDPSSSSHSAIPCDHLGPYAANYEEIRARARAKFGLKNIRKNVPQETSAESATAPLGGTNSATIPSIQSLSENPHSEIRPPQCDAPSSPVERSPENPGPSVSAANVVGRVPSHGDSPTDGKSHTDAETSSVVYNSTPYPSSPSLTPLPSVLDPKITSYAIRRWRSFLPRRYHELEHDDSWVGECPCGTVLPCDAHHNLWLDVRHLKPSDPNYADALTRYGVPVYVPKPEELQIQTQPVPVKK